MLVVVIKCQEQGDTPAITLILRSSFIPNSKKKEMVELTKEEFAVNKELGERWTLLATTLLNEDAQTRETLLDEFEACIAASEELEELSGNTTVTDRRFLCR